MNDGQYEPLVIDEVSRRLKTHRLGRRIFKLDQTHSTNDVVLEMARRAGLDEDGSVVIAEHQTAGRGRHGRHWAAPPGSSLLMSVVLVDSEILPSAPRVSLLAGVAICEAIEATTDVTANLRWPNDVYFRDGKLGGILVERVSGAAGEAAITVIGIGLNCNQSADDFAKISGLRRPALSLAMATGHAVPREPLAAAVLQALDDWMMRHRVGGDVVLQNAWLHHSDDVGKRITVTVNGSELTGVVEGVEPTSQLVLRDDAGALHTIEAATASVMERWD